MFSWCYHVELHHAKRLHRAIAQISFHTNVVSSQCPHCKSCRESEETEGLRKDGHIDLDLLICDAPGRAFMPYRKKKGSYLPEHARSPITSSLFVSTFYCFQWFCKQAVKTVIRLCEFVGWTGHSLLAYHMRTSFLGCKNICSTHSFSMWLLSNILSLFM